MAQAETVLGEAAGAILLAQYAVAALIQLGHEDLVVQIQREAMAKAPDTFSEADSEGLDRDKIIDAAQVRVRAIVAAARVKLAIETKRPT
jgi:glutamine amidotransferase PdxT